MSKQTRQLAERIARDLFTNGAGHHALRLDLFIGEGRHFGGWSEVGLANRVEKFLAEAAGASVPQEAAEATIASLREALRTYGEHKRSCATRTTSAQTWPTCNCGLTARLTGEASSAPQGTATAQPQATVTRLEVIDHRIPDGMLGVDTGRVYSARNCAVELSYQDDGRTLKVFIDGTRS